MGKPTRPETVTVDDHLEQVQKYLDKTRRAPVQTVELLEKVVEHLDQIDGSLALLNEQMDTLLDQAEAARVRTASVNKSRG